MQSKVGVSGPKQRAMKALLYDKYGGPEVMYWGDRPDPVPGAGQVTVRVEAASINPVDMKVRQGAMRIITGGRMPRGMGCDVAGRVERIGAGVTGMKPGDAVFGYAGFKASNTFAELALLPADLVVHKPDAIPFAEAACLPQAGVAALRALREKADLKAGQQVLVVGCTGGVGQFVVMVAKALGARVWGVCGGDQSSAARALGCDAVIDHRKQDLATLDARFHVVFDTPGALGFAKAAKPLLPRGHFLDLNAKPQAMLTAWAANALRARKHHPLITKVRREDLQALARLAADGKLRPLIGRTAPLHEGPAVIAAMERRERTVGKTVLVGKV